DRNAGLLTAGSDDQFPTAVLLGPQEQPVLHRDHVRRFDLRLADRGQVAHAAVGVLAGDDQLPGVVDAGEGNGSRCNFNRGRVAGDGLPLAKIEWRGGDGGAGNGEEGEGGEASPGDGGRHESVLAVGLRAWRAGFGPGAVRWDADS